MFDFDGARTVRGRIPNERTLCASVDELSAILEKLPGHVGHFLQQIRHSVCRFVRLYGK
jgi:hypothetical protein